eukprot:7304546-Pyramimonas_sp.AAC.1
MDQHDYDEQEWHALRASMMPGTPAIACAKMVERAIAELAQESNDRVYASTFIMTDRQESAHVANWSGVLPGDPAAIISFVKAW